jgi:hypothetical protein
VVDAVDGSRSRNDSAAGEISRPIEDPVACHVAQTDARGFAVVLSMSNETILVLAAPPVRMEQQRSRHGAARIASGVNASGFESIRIVHLRDRQTVSVAC